MAKPVNVQRDELAKELLLMLDNAGINKEHQTKLMLQLVPYIVRRDHKVFKHGYRVGSEK